MRLFLLTCLILPLIAYTQRKTTVITGRVLNDNEAPISKVSVLILGKTIGSMTNDSGVFRMQVPVNKAFALVFSHTGYKTLQRNFLLNENEQEHVVLKLEKGTGELQAITVKNQRERREAGMVTLNPKNAINIPLPVGGIESLIKVFVGSNNELTSQYSVRGGNYDENLIYVNDFEVFRPYLVSSGQQEGLSFINPEMTRTASFYNGGFQAKYGDKMSSVLDIQYRKPKEFGGSAYIGLLEQGFHLEGISRNKKISFLTGIRNRSNRNLLGSQEVKGNYVPSSSDFQALLTWQIDKQWSAELLGNFSQTRFKLMPSYSEQTSSVFSPLFTENIGLDIYFDGREEDHYSTNMLGLSVIKQVHKDLRLKWMLSRFQDREAESMDITGEYIFGKRGFDKTQADFGMIVNPMGQGVYQNYNRNRLNINVWNFGHKGYLDKGRHYIQWGINVERQNIDDHLNEWQYQDSAGYSLPHNPSNLALFNVLQGKGDLDLARFSGYLQDNIAFGDSTGFTMQGGLRYNYNTLNKEFLLSPRVSLSWTPRNWKKDIIFKSAIGLYNQPPFYREMRRYDGTLNTDLKAQKSWQITGGMDYSFKALNRPFRFTTEAYYKQMTDVVSYDIDNVRLRYSGENNAKAYATGIELRLFGEIVKDAESWVSLGLMRTRENLYNDFYYDYKNAAGEIITSKTTDRVIADSILHNVSWLRRPTDRLITFGMFFQDYLSTNKNIKMFLNTLYGSNLPYNIPGSVKYRNALVIEPYIRVDIGFGALLLDSDRSNRRSHSPFRNFENIWATLEIFNIIDRANTISYLLIKDFSNATYTIPNRLTPRLLNLKLIARF